GVFSVGAEDSDGVIRRLPLVMQVGTDFYPSLALELLRVASGTLHVMIRARSVGGIGDVVVAGGLVIPTGWHCHIRPRFFTASLRTFSVLDVLEGGLAPGSLTNMFAVVGTSAAGLRDTRRTPVDWQPGVYLHAIALDNILTGSLLLEPLWSKPVELG